MILPHILFVGIFNQNLLHFITSTSNINISRSIQQNKNDFFVSIVIFKFYQKIDYLIKPDQKGDQI